MIDFSISGLQKYVVTRHCEGIKTISVQVIITKKVSESWLLLPISERVLALPIPEIPTHCFEVLRCLEAQLALGQRRISSQIWDISASDGYRQLSKVNFDQRLIHLPSTNNFILILITSSLAHCFNNLEHAHTPTLSKVVCFVESFAPSGEDRRTFFQGI